MPPASSMAVDLKSLFALISEWLIISGGIVAGLVIDQPWCYLIAGLVIATRQHALLILFHDAVHGHLARTRTLNDTIINAFAGVPALLPVEIYRPLHLLHHRQVGTEEDPERLLLYARQPWNYRPLRANALLRQLLGDCLLVNGIRTIIAWLRQFGATRIAARTCAVAGLWIAVITAGAVIAPEATMRALLLWFIPLLTVTQLLQKLRSFAEHSGGPGVTPGWPFWTYSWKVGLIGRLTIWPYNINYHREHHDKPALRWHELPGAGSRQRLDATRLWSLLRQH